MAKGRLRLTELSLDEKEMKCADVEQAYTDHVAVFTTGAARKVVLAGVRTTLHGIRADISAAESALALLYAQQHDAEAAVDAQLTEELKYVEDVADGNGTIIAMANIELQDAPAPRPVPGKVENLSTSSGDDEGDGEAQWKAMRNIADDFEVQTCTTADGVYQHYDVVKKSKVTLKGMASGAKLYVRVRARNAAGKGPWSDIACVRIT